MRLLIILFTLYAGIAGAEEGHWSYTGKNGPANWEELDTRFEACGEGKFQSPINLTNKYLLPDKDHIIFHYSQLGVEYNDIIKNPHTIEVKEEDIGAIEIDKKLYKLAQFHFHIPSEHTVDNKRYDMELHFVHQGENSKLAVVGVFIKKGKSNQMIKEIIDTVKKSPNKPFLEDNRLTDLLPKNQNYYYNYAGSLTTPPCSEGVDWYIFKTPIEASEEEINEFKKIVGMNARPLQRARQ